jgi:hypothetical protein
VSAEICAAVRVVTLARFAAGAGAGAGAAKVQATSAARARARREAMASCAVRRSKLGCRWVNTVDRIPFYRPTTSSGLTSNTDQMDGEQVGTVLFLVDVGQMSVPAGH